LILAYQGFPLHENFNSYRFINTFKNINDLVQNIIGSDSELDSFGQNSRVMFLKSLGDLEKDQFDEAALKVQDFPYIVSAIPLTTMDVNLDT